jgi:hypothetical protein
MNGLDKEIAELKEFVADLKADRASQKEKDEREAWTKYTSVSIVCIAVLAAIATQLAGKYSSRTLTELNKATFHQAKASDKWGEFQANSIKKNLYETVHELVSKDSAGEAAEIAKREKVFSDKIAKYEDTKEKRSKEATDLEKESEKSVALATESSRHGSGMGSVVSLFQISIALGSICVVTKKKWLWHVSLLVAALATVRMVMVWMS